MDPGWLSNAYLVADEEGGTAVYVDSGAPLEPLLQAVEKWGVTPTHVLRTHAHADHIVHEDELGLPVVTGALTAGGLEVEAIPTPGHSDDMICFVVNGELVFSGDTLFKDTVGGGNVEQIRQLGHGRLHDDAARPPRPSRPHRRDDDRPRVGGEPVRAGLARGGAEGQEPVRVGGEDATLVVWSPDYDGKGKAWVRFADGRDAIVGGSRVERK